jgi:hypothetical protein
VAVRVTPSTEATAKPPELSLEVGLAGGDGFGVRSGFRGRRCAGNSGTSRRLNYLGRADCDRGVVPHYIEQAIGAALTIPSFDIVVTRAIGRGTTVPSSNS